MWVSSPTSNRSLSPLQGSSRHPSPVLVAYAASGLTCQDAGLVINRLLLDLFNL